MEHLSDDEIEALRCELMTEIEGWPTSRMASKFEALCRMARSTTGAVREWEAVSGREGYYNSPISRGIAYMERDDGVWFALELPPLPKSPIDSRAPSHNKGQSK